MPASLPRFVRCPVCGLHARIEYPGGHGPEACSQESAQRHLMTAVAEGRVPLEAVEDLYHQIEGSRLPVFEEQADAGLAEAIRRWNGRKRPGSETDFHRRVLH